MRNCVLNIPLEPTPPFPHANGFQGKKCSRHINAVRVCAINAGHRGLAFGITPGWIVG